MDSTTLRRPLEEIAKKKPICVAIGAAVGEAIQKMQEHRIGCIFVTENDKLIGIITERDVMTKVVGSRLNVKQTKVDEIMTRDPEYLYRDDEIAFALNRMHIGGFRHIPLIDLKGRPTGAVSVRDIFGYLVQNLGDNN